MKFDPRSLAAFRILLGLILFGQSMLLAFDIHPFYSAGELLPPAVFASPSSVETFSKILLWGIIPFFSLGFMVGALTRFCNLVCFLGLILIQDSNPEILQGGDVLLRLLFFWSFFLPLGEVWSIDRLRFPSSLTRLSAAAHWATWAYTLQICFVYWFAALLKSDPLWTQNGNALFYALNLEHFTTPFGLYLRQFPDLLRILTFATRVFEFLGPCLLFFPFYRHACRMAAVVLFVGFHLIGMELLLRIGLFPFVCAVAWIIFIPPLFWDWIFSFIRPSKSVRSAKKHHTYVPSAWDYVRTSFVCLAFLDVLLWNLVSIGNPSSLDRFKYNDIFGKILHLNQQWNMYAPYPRREHGWLVVPADLADGSQVDLFTGKPVSWDKPVDIGTYLGDDRWRRYLSNLFNNRDPETLKRYADYLVRTWNQNHFPRRVVQVVTIYFMEQSTQNDLTVTTPRKDVLLFHSY